MKNPNVISWALWNEPEELSPMNGLVFDKVLLLNADFIGALKIELNALTYCLFLKLEFLYHS